METLGRYEVVSRLASGGMGEVFLARTTGHLGIRKLLVLKTILPELAEDAELVGLFLDEARLATRLNHPHICQVFDFGVANGTYFLAMEHVLGVSVSQLLRKATQAQRPVPHELCCRIVADAAEGLHAAHRLTDEEGRLLGVVHRDVSPSNLLVSVDGTTKVIDFGIAQAANRVLKSRPGDLKGKAVYMSPEQASGQPVEPQSDIFSLGLVFHELLTGQRVFQRATDIETLEAVRRCEVPKVSALVPSLPPGLDALVEKALVPEPLGRYRTAEEFRLALENWLVKSGALATTAQVAAFVGEVCAERIATERARLREAESKPPGAGPGAASEPATPKDATSPTSDGRSNLQPLPPTTPLRPLASQTRTRAAPSRRGRWVLPAMLLALGAAAVTVRYALERPAPLPSEEPTAPASSLTVVSEPAGATVRLDGVEVGKTPLLGRPVPKGPTTVSVSKAGFLAQERAVEVTAELTVSFALQPARVKVRLDSTPAGATVKLGEQTLGVTPLQWEAVTLAPVLLRFERTGFLPREVEVRPSDGLVVSEALAPAPAAKDKRTFKFEDKR